MEKVINFPKVLIIGGNSLVGSTLSNYVKDTFDLYHTYHNTTISSKNSIQIDLVKEPQKILDLINKIIGEINLRQIYSGMRGMLSMVTETSKLDPNEGIRFRGYSLPEIQDMLPRAKNSNQPLPEGMFYLMLIGELPKNKDVKCPNRYDSLNMIIKNN